MGVPITNPALVLVLVLAPILVAPIALAAAIAIGRGESRRTLLVLAGTALVALAAGVVYYDGVTGLRSQFAFYRVSGIAEGSYRLSSALLIMGIGGALNLAAVVLGMGRAARLRAWGWFIALVLSLVLANVAVSLFGTVVPGLFASYDFAARLNEGDSAVSTPYFLLASVLTVVPPVVPLLFALRRDRPASTAAGAPVAA